MAKEPRPPENDEIGDETLSAVKWMVPHWSEIKHWVWTGIWVGVAAVTTLLAVAGAAEIRLTSSIGAAMGLMVVTAVALSFVFIYFGRHARGLRLQESARKQGGWQRQIREDVRSELEAEFSEKKKTLDAGIAEFMGKMEAKAGDWTPEAITDLVSVRLESVGFNDPAQPDSVLLFGWSIASLSPMPCRVAIDGGTCEIFRIDPMLAGQAIERFDIRPLRAIPFDGQFTSEHFLGIGVADRLPVTQAQREKLSAMLQGVEAVDVVVHIHYHVEAAGGNVTVQPAAIQRPTRLPSWLSSVSKGQAPPRSSVAFLQDAGAAAGDEMRRVLATTKKTFDLIALTGASFSHQWLDEVRAAARRGVSFRFLFLSPESPLLEVFASTTGVTPRLLREQIIHVLRSLLSIEAELTTKIEVGLRSESVPLYSGWISDGEGADGRSQIKTYLHSRTGAEDVIFRCDDPVFRQRMLKAFNEAWTRTEEKDVRALLARALLTIEVREATLANIVEKNEGGYRFSVECTLRPAAPVHVAWAKLEWSKTEKPSHAAPTSFSLTDATTTPFPRTLDKVETHPLQFVLSPSKRQGYARIVVLVGGEEVTSEWFPTAETIFPIHPRQGEAG